MNKRPRSVVGRVVEFVALNERRRLLVVLGIPTVFVVSIDIIDNYGVVIILLGVGLATVLYTRSTAQKTIAASLSGVGLLLLSLFLLDLYWNIALGSTAPLIDTAIRALWQAVMGTVSVGLGLWLRQIDL